MEKPLLNDKEIYPDDAVLTENLGKAKEAYDAFSDIITEEHPLVVPEWNFYNDGKTWLRKNMLKKKNLFWLSIWPDMFKVTFYFTAKNDADIEEMDIDAGMKQTYFESKSYGKLKAFTIEVKQKKDLEPVKKLIEYKKKMK